MSVASVKNGSLQLSELIISNEKFSNANGYTPTSSSFSSSVNNVSLDVPSISSDTIILGVSPNTVELSAESNTLSVGGGNSIVECGNIVSSGLLTLGASGNTVQLSGTSNTLSVGGGNSLLNCGSITTSGSLTVESGQIQLGASPDPVVTLQCLANGTLTVGGNVRGAMSKSTFTINVDLNAGEAVSAQTTLPNFTGISSSAYVASCNYAGALGLIVGVDFVSSSGGNTLVEVFILNNTAGSINLTDLPFSVIGMA